MIEMVSYYLQRLLKKIRVNRRIDKLFDNYKAKIIEWISNYAEIFRKIIDFKSKIEKVIRMEGRIK